MNETVENLILEQLRAIRADMSDVKDRLETVEAKMDGMTVILVNFGKNIHDLDERVERIEEKLGIAT